jgi:subtilisin family serine protease
MKAKWFHIFSLVLVLAVAISAIGPAFAQAGTGGGLSKRDRELLAEAIVNGKPTITLLIAAAPGANNKVASGIQKLGGNVRYREDGISYISAIVPTNKVEAVAVLSGVQSIDLNEIIPLDDPRPEGVVGVIAQPPPSAATPRINPYMPTQDIGAAQFVDANPTWDGRGVTIGIVDTGVSLDHPSLLMTSTGERKIIDWVTFGWLIYVRERHVYRRPRRWLISLRGLQ